MMLRVLCIAFLVSPVVVGMAEDGGFERAFRDWQDAMAEPTAWEPMQVLDATSGADPLEQGRDGSLRVLSGMRTGDIRIKMRTGLQGITAFRLEIFGDDPAGKGARASEVAGIGDFEVLAHDARRPGRDERLRFAFASTDSSQRGRGAGNAIDGDPRTVWAFGRNSRESHAAVFELSKPLESGGDTVLTFRLRRERPGAGLAFRFRITATTRRPPVRELPGAVRAALLLEPTERSPEQRTAVRAFFLSVQGAKRP